MMSKLGSKERPAIVKVETEERAHEILTLCKNKGWQVIIGIDSEEDISDIEKLLNPLRPVISNIKIGRNEPCICGSGKKHKNCCL